MLATSPGWEVDVERGPDWLFVRLGNPDPDVPVSSLADQLWSVLDCHFVYRLVLRLDGVDVIDRNLLSELVKLYRRIRLHGGVMRLCGLSSQHREMLENCRLSRWFPPYNDVREAVMATRRKPR